MARVVRRGEDGVFRALADETRREILDALRLGPLTTGDLAEQHPSMSRFGVMDHLRVLEDAGLVLVERRGRERLNHLNPVPIQRIHDRWTGRFARELAEELISLEGAVSRRGGPPKESDMVAQMPGVMVETIEAGIDIAADASRVWAALTTECGDWWPHRYREDSVGVHLEPVVGGRFLERFDGEGAGALYATVIYVEPPRVLKVMGTMGLEGAAIYVKSYRLEPRGEVTTVRTSASMLGSFTDETLHGYREGNREVLAALQAHVAGRDSHDRIL
jgi:DNA-binding transcriptional ArsR family regulator/uncharacterized protein YndB with AHSA1/START domain